MLIMKRLIFVAILGVIISCVGSSQAAVHVYEPFDYTAGSDINTPLDGGAGFAAGSAGETEQGRAESGSGGGKSRSCSRFTDEPQVK